MWKPFTASSKMSSLTWNRSPAVAISSPKLSPTSSTSTWSAPTRTSKTSAPGKSSSNSNRVGLSNSACFHLSSWIITCTTLGDTMSLGTPRERVCQEERACGVHINERDISRMKEVKVSETNGNANGHARNEELHVPGGTSLRDSTITNITQDFPHPLDRVVAGHPASGAILQMQTGLFELGRNRARLSGATKPASEDQKALAEH